MEFIEHYQNLISAAVGENRFTEGPEELYEPVNYIISHGGKRLRPVMVLMACDLFDGDLRQAIRPALAIEYFHNFTLIHDDIMDNATLRRGQPTVHSVYGANTGILSGDVLLMKSYKFFEELQPELFKRCVSIFTETGILVCEGQQHDVNFETRNDVTYDEYIMMISHKTGVLIGAALKIGALIGGSSEKDAEALYQFGLHVGVAFQIMDDYLDVYGDMKALGKKQAGDIYENKKTALYLLAMEHADEEERKELDYWYSKKTDNIDKVYSVENIFRHVKVEEKALRLVQKHSELAHRYLDEINVSADKKKPFLQLAGQLLQRQF
ncbi:MAG: polyprenyl synthetase family protein [Chryseobacterium sp.]|nr:MAG: polyprenyl synthetase family protein [Chryseobacterium sp.]